MNSPIELYDCPSDLSGDSTGTNYLMVTRPGTAADGARALRFRDFTDGDSRTIIVVEVTGMNVHWAEPRDISVAELKRLVESRGASGHIAGTFNVLCANGAVHTLGPKSLHLLDALTTINGGEQVDFPANK